LAEDAMEKLSPYLKPPRENAWTASAPLPGGDMEGGDFNRFLRALRGKYSWLGAATATRLARAYGTRAERILGHSRNAADLGANFGAGLSQAEIDYLIDQEFAFTPEDILWRRSKLRLHLSRDQIAAVCAYVDARTRTDERPNA
jgi:glycerol-3-phosphate dehydrogenase